MFRRLRRSVANKVILIVILFGAFVSAAVTGAQLFVEYKRELADIDAKFAGIERSYLGSLRRALWIHDTSQLKMLAEGIAAGQDVAMVSISEDGQSLVSVGAFPGNDSVGWGTPITYTYQGRELVIGRLRVLVNLAGVHRRVIDLALTTLITNATTTLLATVFAYFVFSRMVTRHLHGMARHLSGLRGNDLGAEMMLQRRRPPEGEGDELDLLVAAFNGLRSRLRVTQRNVEKGRDELKASERRYRAILDEMIDTYYRTDNYGVITMATPSSYDLLGWRPEELLGKNIGDYYDSPEQHRMFLAAFKAGGGATRAYEAALRHRDGHVVWVSTTARIFRDEDGNIAGVEGIARDVTEQRAAAEAIRSSRNQLRLVADSLPAPILYVDRDLAIRFANRQAADWFMRPVESLIGVDLTTMLTPPQVERMRMHWDAVLMGETQMITDWFSYPDGKVRRLDVRLVPHKRYDEKVDGFFALGLDVTEHHLLEEKLRQSQKMETVGQLTGGVAHDFNNLLGVILGNVELLAEEPEMEADERAHLLSAIQRAGDRGASLTRQLLAFSRMQPLEPAALQLDKDLKAFVSMLRPTIGEKTTVTMKAEPDLRPCMADRGLLESALLNLAINARDAMPKGGDVEIRLSNADFMDEGEAEARGLHPGSYVEIAVSDTGKGIPPEIQAQVFEPFFTTKDVGAGTGLGLSMVYGFATQSGGHVTLESEVGEGTTVRLYLPAVTDIAADAASGPAPKAAVRKKQKQGQRERVLVVEDDADLRRLTASMLERMGYTVAIAQDGPSALMVLQHGPAPDVILTDVRLPNGLLGPEVVRAARGICPDVRVIYMTGFADPRQMANEDLDSGDALINKPFRYDDLAKTIDQVFGRV